MTAWRVFVCGETFIVKGGGEESGTFFVKRSE